MTVRLAGAALLSLLLALAGLVTGPVARDFHPSSADIAAAAARAIADPGHHPAPRHDRTVYWNGDDAVDAEAAMRPGDGNASGGTSDPAPAGLCDAAASAFALRDEADDPSSRLGRREPDLPASSIALRIHARPPPAREPVLSRLSGRA